MKILKFIVKIITEPLMILANKPIIESVVKKTKKHPIIIFVLSLIITGIIAYFLYWS